MEYTPVQEIIDGGIYCGVKPRAFWNRKQAQKYLQDNGNCSYCVFITKINWKYAKIQQTP